MRVLYFNKAFNPLSVNPIKCPSILKQFVGKLPRSCLSVFDHFVVLALEGLIFVMNCVKAPVFF